MIFGRGLARSDDAIIAEYHAALEKSHHIHNSNFRADALRAPVVMGRHIGKPILSWSNDAIISLYQSKKKGTVAYYNIFLTFLLFRGYHRATLQFLMTMNLDLSRCWGPCHDAMRSKILQTAKALGYKPKQTSRLPTGVFLNLLIWALIVTHMTLEELTRDAFEAFRDEYQNLYRQQKNNGHPNSRLTRLERYLEYWGVLPEAVKSLHHEKLLAQLRNEGFKEAFTFYLKWCDATFDPRTVNGIRTALLTFCLWLQEQVPDTLRLNEMSRQQALSYAQFLKERVETGRYSKSYANMLYMRVRLFFDFVIEERTPSAPARNPFSRRDLPRQEDMIPRYFSDHELKTILTYCEQDASLFEKTAITVLLHTGIRVMEFITLKASDLVQIGGVWKLHIHAGKGLKDRVIPLTQRCVMILQQWQEEGWEKVNDHLFTHHGRPRTSSDKVSETFRVLSNKLSLPNITAHRFRHTFAVALLNYGIRESALQKLMGHATLGMTLEYGRILDQTVEKAFEQTIENMQEGAHGWVPNFFVQEEYTLFAEGDSISWIQLPVGFCRRNPKLHCESDVKCFLCERFCATPKDLPRLKLMYERFMKLGLSLKADVVAAQIQHLESPSGESPQGFIPVQTVSASRKRGD